MKSSSQSPHLRASFLALVALALPCTANATLLVGWYDFDATTSNESADYSAAGFSGLANKGSQVSVGNGGSNDGSYGTLPSSVPNNDGYVRVLGNTLTFSVTNSSGSDVQLDKLLFDAALQSGTGTVNAQYKIGADPAVSLGGIVNNTPSGAAGASADYGDFVFNLVSLPVLSAGQTISFLFTASPNARIDNIAISGISAIPEPASLLALGCVLGSGLMLRNRRIKAIQA